MCQVNSNETLETQLNRLKINRDRICCKCHEEDSVIVIGTSAKFCENCFKKYFVHKFRASLGKNPVVRHGDSVALAFSGGLASASLLRLLKDGLNPLLPKQLKFSVNVIFVSELCTPLKKEEMIMEHVSDTGFKCHVVKMDEILLYSYRGKKTATPVLATDLSQVWKNVESSIKNDTIKEEFLHRMRYRLLSLKGKELGFKHVLLGESSSRLAVKTMQNIVLGRGALIHDESSFKSTECFQEIGVGLLRPLKDISSKEIAMYNSLHNVESIFISNISTFQDTDASVQSLTEHFLLGLTSNFPATETTVYRTANKVHSKEKKLSNNLNNEFKTSTNYCALCYCSLPCNTEVNCSSKVTQHHSDFNGCTHFKSKLSIEFDLLINKYILVLPLYCRIFCYSCRNILLENFM